MSDIIDITVQETIDVVDITVNPNIIEVNVTRTSGGGGAVPTFQQVTDEGNTTTNDIIVSKASGNSFIQVSNNNNTLTFQVDSLNGSLIELNDANNNNYGSLSCAELLMTNSDAGENVQLNSNYLLIQSSNSKPLIELSGSDFTLTGSVQIKTDLIDGDYTQQLPDKSGTFAMLDDVTGVPYTGATADLDLGEFGLLTGNIEFDTTPTNIPTTAGSMVWNDTDGTVDLKLKGANVTLQIGQENVIRVVNKTATNINLLEANYQAVRVTGAQGQRLKVDLAQATTDALSAETIGLVTETINNNQEGFITTSGLIRNVNTTGSLQSETWADGDILYLSPTTAGRITKVKPTAPNHLVIIGYVVSAHATQGSIFVKVDNGYELNELHNVKITTETNGQALTYTSATDIWENKTIIEDSITNGVTDKAPSQNAVFDALALKQTQNNWVDYSSVVTLVGWSSTSVKFIKYLVQGKKVTIIFSFTGTSNANNITFSLPINAASSIPNTYGLAYGQNNGVGLNIPSVPFVLSNSTVCTVLRDNTGTAWTNSGTKKTEGTIIYEIN
jgi:hypothetical protein